MARQSDSEFELACCAVAFIREQGLHDSFHSQYDRLATEHRAKRAEIEAAGVDGNEIRTQLRADAETTPCPNYSEVLGCQACPNTGDRCEARP